MQMKSKAPAGRPAANAKEKGTAAELLRSARIRAGLTQAECAELLEVSLSWVTTVERGTRTPMAISLAGAAERLAAKEAALAKAGAMKEAAL